MLGSGSALALGCLVGVILGCLSLTFAQITPDAGAMPAFLTQLGAGGCHPSRDDAVPADVPPLSSDARRFGVLVGLIDIGAVISMVIAFQRGNVAVVAAMLGFAPVTTMTLAWRIYHEAVRRWQWVGAGLGAFAFILFSTAGLTQGPATGRPAVHEAGAGRSLTSLSDATANRSRRPVGDASTSWPASSMSVARPRTAP